MSSPKAGSPVLIRTLLRVPVFYKILIANGVIVVLGTVTGTTITQAFLRQGAGYSTTELVGVLALAGVVVTVIVNALILRVALGPLRLLEQTAARVQAGDLEARAPYSPLADREQERLTRTFNGMLDTLDSYRQRLRDVAARALNAEEEERKRIARELHDDTAQTLAALLIRLRVAKGTDDPEVRSATLEQFREEVSEALERLRRFARGLRPPALDELGLVPALESHVRGLAGSVGPDLRVEAAPLEARLTPQAELALYRIVQEALSNAIRHANAKHVVARISHQDGMVTATVSDDGCGFHVPQAIEDGGRGLGLFGMQERAAYVGGRVTIESTSGLGTSVRAEIPVAEPADSRAVSKIGPVYTVGRNP